MIPHEEWLVPDPPALRGGIIDPTCRLLPPIRPVEPLDSFAHEWGCYNTTDSGIVGGQACANPTVPVVIEAMGHFDRDPLWRVDLLVG